MRVLCATLVVVFTAGCHGHAPVGSALVVGRPADAIALDPARVTDADSAEVCEQIFDTLVRNRKGSMEIEPALAESWEVSAAGTEWTFHLRRGVRFHDGTRFDADAVLFSLQRQRDPSHPFHEDDFSYFDSTLRNVTRVERIDDYTVRLAIERPYAPFLANLTVFATAIVSPTAVERWGHDFKDHPVGTGPFRLVEWSKGDRITLAANEEYWGGRPHIATLSYVAIHDARQRLVEIEGGAIDVAERLAPEDLQFVSLHPELKLERVAGNNVSYLGMNTEHPPFDDVRVRRAVAHAVNKLPIVKMVFQGLAVPATGALAPSTWGHVDLNEYVYQPELSRRLLAEAGWRGGRRMKLFVMSTPRPYLPSPEKVGQIIARNLHDVGIEVDLVAQPMDAHLRRTSNGEHDLCILGWQGDNGDPDNFLYGLFDQDNAEKPTARNVTFFRDAQLHGILRWAQETSDHAKRLEYYGEAQRIIADRSPWVPLAHAEIVVARRASVKGLVLLPSGQMVFRGVTVEAR